jgi:hypothetical protein
MSPKVIEFRRPPEFSSEYQEKMLLDVLQATSEFQDLGYVILQLSEKDPRFSTEGGYTEGMTIQLLFPLAVEKKIELKPGNGRRQLIKLYSKPDFVIKEISSARKTAELRWGMGDLPEN